MAKYGKIRVKLSGAQRDALKKLASKGIGKASEIRRANVLLMSDEGSGPKRLKDEDIASSLKISRQSVINIKRKFLERGGIDPVAGVKRKRRSKPPVEPKCTGDVEARITAVACSNPPEGRSRWTLRLLSERVVELDILPSISHTKVGQILKKTGTSLT